MSLDDSTILYSKDDHKRVASIFAVQIRYLKINAKYPLKLPQWLPKSLKYFGKLLMYIHDVFLIFLPLHLMLLHMKHAYNKFYNGSLEDITDALIMVVIYTFAFYSTLYLMWYAKPIARFLERVNCNYRHHSLAGLSFVTSYVSYDRARKMMIAWAYAGHSGALLWGFAPIITRTRTLPLNCWYPFDELQPGVYECVYILQLLGQIFMGFAYSNSSGLYVSLLILMLGQYDVLFCSLKNFEYNARLKSGEDLRKLRQIQKEMPLGQDDEHNQYVYGTEYKTDLTVYETLLKNKINSPIKSYQQYLHDALVDCFEHHRFIMDTCSELEELFNPFCLIKSLQIAFQLCLLLFVGVVGERTILRVTILMQYAALTLIELLMYTYFGELLRDHSLRGGDALWRAPWWRNSTHLRQDIIIFLIHCRRAVKLTAGKFFVMDIERFRLVVMQAFSFITLLQKLNAKNVK